MDEIDGKLNQIFSDPGSKNHAGESFDTANMSPEELQLTVEKALANRLVGKPCFSCGEEFDAESATTSYFLGAIDDGKAAYAHKQCFEETVKAHPELQATINKKQASAFTPKEVELWRTAFSSPRQGSAYDNLFRGVK